MDVGRKTPGGLGRLRQTGQKGAVVLGVSEEKRDIAGGALHDGFRTARGQLITAFIGIVRHEGHYKHDGRDKGSHKTDEFGAYGHWLLLYEGAPRRTFVKMEAAWRA